MANIMEFKNRKANQDSSLGGSKSRYLVSYSFCTCPKQLTLPSACVASIMKFTCISSYSISEDFLYDSAGLDIWTTTELNVGILAASIPCLKPLFGVFLQNGGHKPMDNPLDVRGDSCFFQTTDTISHQEYGDTSQTDGTESGATLQTLRKTGFTRTSRVYVGEISEERLLRIHGPVIVKTIETEVRSEKEGSSVVAD
jgi:hypothetical protein